MAYLTCFSNSDPKHEKQGIYALFFGVRQKHGIYALFRAQVILGLLRNDTTMTLFLIRLRRRQVQMLSDVGRAAPPRVDFSKSATSPTLHKLHTGWRRPDSVRAATAASDCGRLT